MTDTRCRIRGCSNRLEDEEDDLGVCPQCGIKIARRYREKLNHEDSRESDRKRAVAAQHEARRRAAVAEITASLFAGHESPREPLELVYYVRLGDHIKIGHSKNLRGRLSALRAPVTDLLAAEPGGRDLEQRRHREFDHLRISKRWENFTPAPDLHAHIANLKDQYGLPQWLRAPRRGRNGPVVVRSRR